MKIKEIKYISTGTGDKGTSRNYDNMEFPKDDILFEVLGTIDELSSNLGLTYHYTRIEELKGIQKILQNINSLIATGDPSRREKLVSISQKDIDGLEIIESKYLLETEITHEFVLPGSESVSSAHLDISRTICRRAERRLITFVRKYNRIDLNEVQIYLNRLSDLLFILARRKEE